MADLVLNEWLWSDLRGETTAEKQRESLQLLLSIPDRTDRIIVVEDSPFARKAWRLAAEGRDVQQREAIRLFKASYLSNPEKCLLLDPRTLPQIPAELVGRCKDDDHYLLQAQEAVPGSIVITTDQPLIDARRTVRLAFENDPLIQRGFEANRHVDKTDGWVLR